MKKKIIILCLITPLIYSISFSNSFMPLEIYKGVKVSPKIKSWVEIRDNKVIKQEYDYSCGSAALATLLNDLFSEKISESQVINTILDNKSQLEIDEISEMGYSMLELKKAAIYMGYNAAIYKINIEIARQIKGPVIIFYEPYGEKHFSVLKKVTDKKAYIADPSRGNIRISIPQFIKEWSGLIMIVNK